MSTTNALGIAAEAARALLMIGFSEMKLHRMFATCLPQNPASVRVLEKIGMRKECSQLKALNIHGVWHDCFMYAVLREEWEAACVAISVSALTDARGRGR